MKFVVALLAAAAVASPLSETMTRLLDARDELQAISFAAVIRETTGKRVFPVDPKTHAAMLHSLGTVLDAALAALNAPEHPMHRVDRINEASRAIEDELRARLTAVPAWRCVIPRTNEGREQRAGYPDLRLETDVGLVDLSRVHVRLKAEFQASNVDLYQETSVISRSSP